MNNELTESTMDDLKLVLVSLAKSNISRLFLLNSHLDILEDKIIEKANNEDLSIRELLDIYSSLRTSVNEMSKLIQQITADPTITSIIIQNTQVINQVSSEDERLLDKDSRLKVRQALSKILDTSSSVIE